jgi:hypothetical protein
MDVSRAHLMPTDQKASYAIIDIALNSTIRYLCCAVELLPFHHLNGMIAI